MTPRSRFDRWYTPGMSGKPGPNSSRPLTEREKLERDARAAVLQPVFNGLSGPKRDTKRKAVEAAFEYGIEWWCRIGEHNIRLVADRPDEVQRYEREMYAFVKERMLDVWTWLILWLLVKGAVWLLVQALVAWLLNDLREKYR